MTTSTTSNVFEYYLPAGKAARGPYAVDIDPARAGWGYSSLRVLELLPGGRHAFDTGESEWIVLPLAGSCSVAAEGQAFQLHGRESVFSGVTDFAYLPRDAQACVASRDGGRFALTGARCARRLPARYGPASAVPVELRGTGNCTRQVNNFAAAGSFEADKLIAVEVLTPGGNWSSYPAHKHDEHRPGEESELEEIYYYEIAAGVPGVPGVPGAPSAPSPAGAVSPLGAEGFGYQRVSPSGHGRGTDVLAEVRTGDTVLIPDGWHGPAIAAPGHHMYYLNVMAGPGDEREWLICDHPDQAWIRASWAAQAADPRLPLYRAPETSAPEKDLR